MPRFDNEGFNPKQRIDNDTRDRSVPDDENYYGAADIDLGFNSRASGAEVRDNQASYYADNPELLPPTRSSRQQSEGYISDVSRDFDAERRRRNEERAAERRRRNEPKPKRKRRAVPKPKKILRGILAFILAIVLILSIMAGSVLGKINYDEHKKNEYVSAFELKRSPFVKNILLLGVDARPKQESETSRADSMMIVSIDMKHKCIKMVSFLRDSWVYIPAKDGEQRLNAASTYDGYKGISDTIEYNFGIKLDGYIVTDFEMFKAMVDSIGGVEIEVTEKEAKEVTKHKKRYGNVKLESGKQTLTGEQALAYSRIRKIDTDFMRAKRQRTVITSILGKVKKNPYKLYSLAKNSAPYLETNLTKSQLIRIAASALPCLGGDMPQARVPFEDTWEYANKGGASVIAINTEKNKELLIDYIYNKTAEELKEVDK